MPDPITFRQATADDCAQLVLYADMASRGLTSHLWGLQAAPGQSAMEVGRDAVRHDDEQFVHYRNWLIASRADTDLGGLLCYEVKPQSSTNPQPLPPALAPLVKLKDATVGCWHVSVAAVLSEARGQGIGGAMLARAEADARARALPHLTLTVGSFNTGALSLYQRVGYREWAREAFVPFAGSDTAGDWILMGKDTGG